MKALQLLQSGINGLILSGSKDTDYSIQLHKEAIEELKTLQSNYEAQEIIIADLKKQLEPKNCEGCKWLSLNQCKLPREVELSDGVCGEGYIEIDAPSIYYCADYEPKDN